MGYLTDTCDGTSAEVPGSPFELPQLGACLPANRTAPNQNISMVCISGAAPSTIVPADFTGLVATAFSVGDDGLCNTAAPVEMSISPRRTEECIIEDMGSQFVGVK